jgi:hypothetical protein
MRAGNTCLRKLFGAGVLTLSLQMQGNPQVPDSTNPAAPRESVPAQISTLHMTHKIAGSLPDTVKARTMPYLVVGDIEVPVNKTVTIEKGVVFLFKTFTGMHVLGKLNAQGTSEAPIIFTSENDSLSGAETSLHAVAYDWNGIYFHECAVGSKMSFCTVKYSVYGIVSETKYIKLSPVNFSFNGKSDLVIEGKKQAVTDQPFLYNNFSEILIDPLAYRRTTLRYAGIAVAIMAGAGTVYYAVQWNKAQTYLSSISKDDPPNVPPPTYQKNKPDWKNAQTKRNNFINYTVVSGTLAMLGMIGVGWSFTF